jgi:hypothetical protein
VASKHHSKHYLVTGLGLALVVAAVAAPSASARTADEFLNSQPATASGSAPTVRPQVLPNPDNQPAANPSDTASSSPVKVRVVHAAPGTGFDWGDAGIGAGAAVALTMIGLGGLLLVGNRRQRHAPPARAA